MDAIQKHKIGRFCAFDLKKSLQKNKHVGFCSFGGYLVNPEGYLVRYLTEELDADQTDFHLVIVVTEVFHCCLKRV